MARKVSPPVDVRRSTRRRRTVSAYRDGERVVVLIPDQFSSAEEAEWVDRMLGRLSARDKRAGKGGDSALRARAVRLAGRYYPEYPVAAAPTSVRWVDNQNSRWGSCTPDDRTIRLSTRLATMPGWVIDYVLLHELAHLVVPRHGKEFWSLVERYPKTERARGYLEGIADASMSTPRGSRPR
ncbi:MAG TPA: M48 family metallopeptidase [Stackebrandtia sp.]|jgi:predicted metal-dependent hydrolase|uniref:M48 metallopeptidase family protein n=1 Tax=Stackebrandtia sp. TaxID=2023065 RepID=UPI002D5B4F0D|nr:M48 family metallopeptidase [Stackebrandtia sp.]HZE39104.1 M48 family metallopeptidase [Stackebrandtia sp.]